MLTFVSIVQVVAILLLVVEGVYIMLQRPSHSQVWMLMLILSTLIMMIGYWIELTSTGKEAVMAGVSFAYVGKPFTLLFSLLFIADYCGRPFSKKSTVLLFCYEMIFPIVVFTNNYHHLFYSSVSFNGAKPISPLTLSRAPLYYLYMFTIVAHFAIILFFTLREYRSCTTRKARHQAMYLFGIVFFSIVGYVVYLTGITGGYDTTMLGSFIGVLLLVVLFLRYHIFDSLLLAKDRALDTATNGFLVFANNGKVLYSNNFIRRLYECGFEEKTLRKLPFGETVLHSEGRVFDAKKTLVVHRGRVFGSTVELTDITDRFNYSVKLEEEVSLRTKELRHVQRSVISSFAGIVEARDSITGVHVKNVGRYVEIVARQLVKDGIYTDELTEDFITCLADVSPLHDIGKLSISDNILLKEGPLTEEERNDMKLHTVFGAQIATDCLDGVEEAEFVRMAEDVAHYHHERWDGTGYPTGLSGENIPLSARITAIADVYDAIRSERSYKSAMSCEESRTVIEEGRGTFFDPYVVDAFMKVLPEIEAISKLPRETVKDTAALH